MYCLAADGALLDACLLAATAALADVQLPALALRPDGTLAAVSDESRAGEAELPGGHARRLVLPPLPAALTCGLYRGQLLVDPTAEEEALLGGRVCVALTAEGTLLAVHKAGPERASEELLMRCVAAARLRHAELSGALAAARAARGESS